MFYQILKVFLQGLIYFKSFLVYLKHKKKVFFAQIFFNFFFKWHVDLVWHIYPKRRNRRGIISYESSNQRISRYKIWCAIMLLSILFRLTSTNIFLCNRREVKIVFDIYPPLKSTHCRESPPEGRVITHNYHHSE